MKDALLTVVSGATVIFIFCLLVLLWLGLPIIMILNGWYLHVAIYLVSWLILLVILFILGSS